MGRPSFKIRNLSGVGLYFATVVIKDSCAQHCPNNAWESAGWVRLEDGWSSQVSNPSSNRWVYYYAERDDGRVYRGSFPADARTANFRKCVCFGLIPNPYFRLGFRALDTDQHSGIDLRPGPLLPL